MSIFKRIIKQDVEIARALNPIKRKCRCGHSLYVPKYRQSVKCNWCGRLVFYSDKDEFKYRLMKEMKRKK